MNKNGAKLCLSYAVLSAKSEFPKPDAIPETLITHPAEERVEILTVDQECPFYHFTRLQREGNQIVCQICGYGRTVFT